jgi:hypothetical protein
VLISTYVLPILLLMHLSGYSHTEKPNCL